MGSFLQVLSVVVIGVFLLWFGYSLFFGGNSSSRAAVSRNRKPKKQPHAESYPGAPRTCPVCSARLEPGERVKSAAFPSMGGIDRLMHINGCPYCLAGDRRRSCPVCGAALEMDEILIARMFDKPGRSHVHVLGCSHCRGPGRR
jgi:predicted nucleic acid-binding Zn ribbon protein